MAKVRMLDKLAVAVAAALSALCVAAATCEGVTKTGARCKREAAEGSRYCLGHADQAKKADAKAEKSEKAKAPKAKAAKAKAEKAKSDEVKSDVVKMPKAKAEKAKSEKAKAEKAKAEKAKDETAKAHKDPKAKAKKAAKAKAGAEKSSAALKDDGTCWAVTESGTRCKHKKDGESDYCKLHGPDVKPTKAPDQCRALKWDGERCTRRPEEGYLYCAQHRKLGANAEKKDK
ncbi:MAG: hypothetical protein IKE55_00260 [Kiritimatiellae bacterium]|nr:hypothetical protein [Kiritimatiellia bacterium]